MQKVARVYVHFKGKYSLIKSKCRGGVDKILIEKVQTFASLLISSYRPTVMPFTASNYKYLSRSIIDLR